MGNQLLASKIVSKESTPSIRNIPAVATAIIAVEGIAERGPVNTPTLCLSWADYVKTFGGYTTDGDLATIVYCIYLNDPGANVWVNRIVHYTNILLPATKVSAAATINIPGTVAVASAGAVTSGNIGPFNLEPGQTLIVHCDEDGAGPDTVTFDAARATTAGGAPAIAAMNGKTVIFNVDNGETQTVTFTAAAVDVPTTLAELNGQSVNCSWIDDGGGNMDAFSDLYGTDSEFDITGGTALVEIGHAIGTDNGTGDCADIDAVTFAEAKIVIEADVINPATGVTVTAEVSGAITVTSDTTGAGSSVQMEVASTAVGFGFDNALHSGSASSVGTVIVCDGKTDGTYAHDLRLVIAAATNGEATYFNASVTDSAGIVLEPFANMQVADDTALDFVETVFNHVDSGSLYLELTDQATTNRPDNGTYTPAAGDDGITLIDANDWAGSSVSKLGLHAFAEVSTITLLLDGGRATAAWQNAMVTYIETTRSSTMFGIFDPPQAQTAAQMVTWVKTTAALKNLTEHGAIFWPRLKIVNPSPTVFGAANADITVPPCGIVAGLISATDNSKPGGIYTPPAGVENGILRGVVGFETDTVLDEDIRDLVYPEQINPLTTIEGFPRHNDGVKTLKATGQFPTIAERRGVIYMQRQITNGLQFARHRNNDADLRAEVTNTVRSFLIEQMKLGAFRTKDPDTAFFVDFSEALNTPAVINSFKLLGRIGLATQKPAEWIILTFSQDTRAIEEELAG